MNKSHLLINEQSLQVLPSLAVAVGLEESIVLQQLHYWLNNPKNEGRIDENGDKWVYNTYTEWREDNFKFWTEEQIKRYFLSLEKQGVVIAKQLDAKRRDMRKFYRIDYEFLHEIEQSVEPKNHSPIMQNSTMQQEKSARSIDSNSHDVKMNHRLPENTNIPSLKTDEVKGAYLAGIEASIYQGRPTTQADIDASNVQSSSGIAWRGRELLPPQYISYGDWWHAKTGLHMYGAKAKAKTDSEWLNAFKICHENELTIVSLEAAYKVNEWRTVSKLSQILSDAKAIQAAGTTVSSAIPVTYNAEGMPESW